MVNAPPDDDTFPDKCKRCGGSGTTFSNGDIHQCPRCNGSGFEPDNELTEEQRQALGGAGGAALGFSLGGPAGALVGGLIGAALTSIENDDEEEEDPYLP